jgi:hypothetical protein
MYIKNLPSHTILKLEIEEEDCFIKFTTDKGEYEYYFPYNHNEGESTYFSSAIHSITGVNNLLNKKIISIKVAFKDLIPRRLGNIDYNYRKFTYKIFTDDGVCIIEMRQISLMYIRHLKHYMGMYSPQYQDIKEDYKIEI